MKWHSDAAAGKNARPSRPWLLSRQVLAGAMSLALLAAGLPLPVQAQNYSSATASAQDEGYSNEQLDALLAPIALYPDALLTQILMASTYPDQITAAYKWVQNPANKALTGNALDQALVPMAWDPSVKSLVPFPQVLEMMSDNIDWTNQLGYAMTVQQSAVMASVQRLRAQAQAAGQLQSNAQQTVTNQGSTIIIAPAQPSVVYVPAYNPTVVYGVWPYPAYPPVYYPPPVGYYAGSALVAGMAFGAGVAISASLWGWASPNWGRGYVNVNVNRYNNINVNRTQIHNSNWSSTNRNWSNNSRNWNGNNSSGNRPGAGNRPPPAGPVGRPAPQKGLPANSIGRPTTSVPGNITRPPAGMGPQTKPNFSKPPANMGGNKPAFGQGGARPPGGQPSTRPSTRPAAPAGNGQGMFSGVGDGRSAAQFGNRGAQSQRSAGGFNGGARGGGGGFGGSGRSR